MTQPRSQVLAASKLPKRHVEKVWGSLDLPADFAAPKDKRIGEIWFAPPKALDHVLIKFLFTSQKLSVQVHPSDAQAAPGEAGKDECWLILDAEPDAQVAIGFKREVTPSEMEQAALDGSIEHLLEWHAAIPGRFFYLPAGTVHAIGAGITLVEVQQNSDTTFRLYDYGRPRELHLDHAAKVASMAPYDRQAHAFQPAPSDVLADGPHFRLDRIIGQPGAAISGAYSGALLALPLSGQVRSRGAHSTGLDGAGLGECLLAPSIDAIDFSQAQTTLLVR